MSTATLERVRTIVAEGKMTRAGLARAAGLHANTLRDCTEPNWNPTADTLGKLERFLAASDDTPVLVPIEQIIDDFAFLDEWEDRYRYVIELGKALPGLPEDKQTAANKVQGCASQVWLVSHVADGGADPVMDFEGDSDAHIVRGLVAIVLAVYSGRPASQIAATDAIEIFDRIGLVEHLSSQRANGLRSMVKRIREEARVKAPA